MYMCLCTNFMENPNNSIFETYKFTVYIYCSFFLLSFVRSNDAQSFHWYFFLFWEKKALIFRHNWIKWNQIIFNVKQTDKWDCNYVFFFIWTISEHFEGNYVTRVFFKDFQSNHFIYVFSNNLTRTSTRYFQD